MAEKKPTTTKKPAASAKAKTISKKSPIKKTTTSKPKKDAKVSVAKSGVVKSTATQKKPLKSTKQDKSVSASEETVIKQSDKVKKSFFKRIKKEKKTKVITNATLYTWNKWLALLHLLQGAVILVLSTSQTFPVVTNFLAIDPLATGQGDAPVLVSAVERVADINLAYLVATFFVMSAVAHAIVASVYRKKYEAGLANGINRARWIEYSLSASTMIVGIGALVGVTSLSAFIMLFALTAIMNLLGLVMEVANQGQKKVRWLSYIVGCIAGIVPWIVISEYLLSGAVYGDPAPTFVYAIFVSMFLFFSSFAVNMYLQYAGIGKWKDYMYGERAYMILSLVAKSALAWQIFAGTLRP
jgi:Heliorhodopsin